MPSSRGLGLQGPTAIQDNVRRMLLQVQSPAQSSLYSGTPNPEVIRDLNENPRSSPRGFFGRIRDSVASQRTQLLPSHTPGHQTSYSPASQPSEWSRLPDEPERAAQPAFRHPADAAPVLDEERDLEEQAPAPRSKRHKKSKRRRRQQRRDGVWVRQHGQRKKSGTCMPLLHGPTRVNAFTCIISGLFLASVLTICMLNLYSRGPVHQTNIQMHRPHTRLDSERPRSRTPCSFYPLDCWHDYILRALSHSLVDHGITTSETTKTRFNPQYCRTRRIYPRRTNSSSISARRRTRSADGRRSVGRREDGIGETASSSVWVVEMFSGKIMLPHDRLVQVGLIPFESANQSQPPTLAKSRRRQ